MKKYDEIKSLCNKDTFDTICKVLFGLVCLVVLFSYHDASFEEYDQERQWLSQTEDDISRILSNETNITISERIQLIDLLCDTKLYNMSDGYKSDCRMNLYAKYI